MALIFLVGLFVYYLVILRRRKKGDAVLAKLLWFLYAGLGVSGVILEITKGITPVFKPNYLSAFFLLICVILCISGFLRFHVGSIAGIGDRIYWQKIIEDILMVSQIFAMLFFLPFAIESFSGNINENRLLLDDKMRVLGSFGLINTFAGAASQLFVPSLVMAFIRFSSDRRRNIFRGLLLSICSLSYIVYIFAYVGRDGVVYWLMTFIMILSVFSVHFTRAERKRILAAGSIVSMIIFVPFGLITISRFFDADQGGGWSFLEYFGAQIQNFGDYSSINRPITHGIQNFPMFIHFGCGILGLNCPSWIDIKEAIFSVYLSQGKAPWLFGTFISDFVGDFGEVGTLIIILIFTVLCMKVSLTRPIDRSISLARFLLVLFLFSIPYWGVFYFRFSIINGFIVVNLIFILFVAILQKLGKVCTNHTAMC